MRQCVGCREMKNKKDLVRVLKTPEDQIIIDLTGKMNGRGAYVCKDVNCLLQAKKNKGLERSFKMNIPENVYENLAKEYEKISD